MPAVRLGRVAMATALGGLEIPHSTAISSSFTGFTPRRDQARLEMQLLHLVLGRPLGRFPVNLASRICFTCLSWGILDTWPNSRSCDLSIRRSGSTFRALQVEQLRTLL